MPNRDLPPTWDFDALEADALSTPGPEFIQRPTRAQIDAALETTMNRQLADATRASVAAAESARERGAIQQREVGEGVWVLMGGRAS